ncbi:transcriptional activator protein Pur-beta-like isoform X1 [Corticium candelabrum]|uniref:transcriptional activator protein Pur-beta-like isoform X1 n=1 Tax=Corticium candelabrum TaxID=121492 RepID=UPI002E25C9A3|nr:transcriptional activator protein Pur-beta-like isoform X1 [Corticium candelabrum]
MASGRLDSESAADEGEQQELASRVLQIQSKRVYVDVKQNKRGRFMKISEVAPNGIRGKVNLPMSSVAEFKDYLEEFSQHSEQIVEGSQPGEGGTWKSAYMQRENKRFFLDLKENERGRFLRISQSVSFGQRSQVAIPASGIKELIAAVIDLLTHFGPEDLGESRDLRIDGKKFYFDVGSNERGVYLRISEVQARYRTNITIPQSGWLAFRDTLNEYIEQLPFTGQASGFDMEGEGTEEMAGES